LGCTVAQFHRSGWFYRRQRHEGHDVDDAKSRVDAFVEA
jgi:hypothetical protein